MTTGSRSGDAISEAAYSAYSDASVPMKIIESPPVTYALLQLRS